MCNSVLEWEWELGHDKVRLSKKAKKGNEVAPVIIYYNTLLQP